MAGLSDVLGNIPGLAGYLGMEQLQRQNAMQDLQGVAGLASVLRQQEMAPLQMQLMRAQADQARGLAEDRAQTRRFQDALPGLVEQAKGADGQVDFGKLSGVLMQAPGGLKFGMDLRKTEEDRAARLQQWQANLEQRRATAEQLHEIRLSNARTAEDRAAESARHNQVMEVLSGQMRALAAQNAANRQYPIVQTADGIFERTPQGLMRLTNPQTGEPLRPASLTAGDRGDRRDAMSIYEKTEGDPQVKLFKSVSPKFDASMGYFNEVTKDPGKQSNAADLALVKTFVSMVHPKGDQISNLDMRNIAQLPGLDERIVGAVANVLDGKQLQPKVRADIMQLMTRQYGHLNSQVIGIEDRRRDEARNFGLDPDRAVPRIGRRQPRGGTVAAGTAGAASASQSGASGAPRVIDFNDLPR
jgi:hypothetical protein